MRDFGIALIVAGLIITAAVIMARVTRTRPQPRHAPNPPDEADTFVAELRGQRGETLAEVLEGLPPTDRFSPGVVLPFTPRGGQPLKPAPKLTDEETADLKARFAEAVKKPSLIVLPSRAPDADDAFDDAKAMLTDPEPLLARYERLIDSRPAEVQQLLHYHADTEQAVDSIVQRVLTPDLLAALDKAKEEAVSDA
jgi:hypothetical protein